MEVHPNSVTSGLAIGFSVPVHVKSHPFCVVICTHQNPSVADQFTDHPTDNKLHQVTCFVWRNVSRCEMLQFKQKL